MDPDNVPPALKQLLERMVSERAAELQQEIRILNEKNTHLSDTIRVQQKQISDLKIITSMYEKARIGGKTKYMEQKGVQVDIRFGIPNQENGFPRPKNEIATIGNNRPAGRQSDTRPGTGAISALPSTSVLAIKYDKPPDSGDGYEPGTGAVCVVSHPKEEVECFEPDLQTDPANNDVVMELEGISEEMLTLIRSNLSSCKSENSDRH